MKVMVRFSPAAVGSMRRLARAYEQLVGIKRGPVTSAQHATHEDGIPHEPGETEVTIGLRTQSAAGDLRAR